MKPATVLRPESVPAEIALCPEAAPTVVRYYRETLTDYLAWSPNLNMHFGYFRRGLNPFDRERMLEELTRQVLSRLEPNGERRARVVDLGSGAGGPATLALALRPELRLDGVTLVAEQAELARARAVRARVEHRAAFHVMDYTATRLPSGVFDGAMAIESACHDAGADKAGFIREAARLIAPGGRLAIADGFLKREPRPGSLASAILGRVARDWAVPRFANLAAFRSALARHGFREIEVEEISWHLVPSVLHIPLVTARFLARELVRNGLRLGKVRWGHVIASVLAPLAGLARRDFGYFLVSARKSRGM